ncbi:Nuclear transcription factor Y subunit gamma [Eumeta japonica]|uniref:Nuclear transcription factor Y subunit gamma n=1 Tax=Eumeta variegata TaxID=151549 RepID=A0A4C1T2U0_EUMVA|nr:Nuclear transcription factor Y subunit gamma [Eumeta japonica]
MHGNTSQNVKLVTGHRWTNRISGGFSRPGGGASNASDEITEAEVVTEDQITGDTTQQALHHFWNKVMDDIKKVTAEDFKTQVLPLARIKKIMKLDEEVKMISAEAPVLFAKAAEIFIHELTLRAWAHTEDNKRRTLQRNDIAMAITKSDQFDFLIDIVPRHEVKPTKRNEEPTRVHQPADQYYLHLAQQHQAALASPQQPQIVLQPCTQLVQVENDSEICHQTASTSAAGSAAAAAPAASVSNSAGAATVSAQAQPLLVQQIVTPTGDVQQLPIQLSQAQLNMIRMQMQNNPNQPIVIQTQPQPQPQIIQVSSQTQQQPQQQVFIAQVATPQDTES